MSNHYSPEPSDVTRVERLKATKVAIDDESGCWLWLGSLTREGYATVADRRGSKNSTTAHRLFYRTLVAPIPSGETLHHKCNTRHCVNPDHLQPISQRENVAASFERAALIRARESAEAFVDGTLDEFDDVLHQNREEDEK